MLNGKLLDTIDKSRGPQRGFMYSRTQNENGTFNTRCLDCFLTIASAVETSEQLEQYEVQHVCPEKALAQLMAMERLNEADAQRN